MVMGICSPTVWSHPSSGSTQHHHCDYCVLDDGTSRQSRLLLWISSNYYHFQLDHRNLQYDLGYHYRRAVDHHSSWRPLRALQHWWVKALWPKDVTDPNQRFRWLHTESGKYSSDHTVVAMDRAFEIRIRSSSKQWTARIDVWGYHRRCSCENTSVGVCIQTLRLWRRSVLPKLDCPLMWILDRVWCLISYVCMAEDARVEVIII